jgi:aspartokinase-like uncharacterized kinase
MSGAPARVVKVGGSLLDFELLPAAIREYLAATAPAQTVMLAGGGELCDVIRRHDRCHGLGEEASHTLCVQLLDVSAAMLSRLLPESPFLADWEALKQRLELGEPSPLVFGPSSFLRDVEPHLPGRPLPGNWSTTTDSIAARLAESLDAELVLLKSAPPPPGSLGELSAAGYLDAGFPRAARPLRRVTLVNLRNSGQASSVREFRPSGAC